MDSEESGLNNLARSLYKQHWGLVLDIPIVINPRMRKWTARYMKEYVFDAGVKVGIKGVSIEISNFAVDNYTKEGLTDLLKHELCHHACHSKNKPYTDGSNYFEEELKRIGASSHRNTPEELQSLGYVPRQSTVKGDVSH